jgi:hypothetical protein
VGQEAMRPRYEDCGQADMRCDMGEKSVDVRVTCLRRRAGLTAEHTELALEGLEFGTTRGCITADWLLNHQFWLQ